MNVPNRTPAPIAGCQYLKFWVSYSDAEVVLAKTTPPKNPFRVMLKRYSDSKNSIALLLYLFFWSPLEELPVPGSVRVEGKSK